MTNSLAKLKGFDLLTPMQKKFLNFLAGEARGDLVKAKKLAGYSDSTAVKEVTQNLKEFVKEIAEEILAMGAIKGAHAINDVLDSPAQAGAKTKLDAAKTLLGMVGISEKTEQTTNVQVGTIYILPPKRETEEEMKVIEHD